MLARTRGDLRLPTLLASAILDQSTRTPAELAEARQLSEDVLDAVPGAATVYVNLGSVHYFEGERDRALASWQRAFELEPSGQAVFTDTINRRHPAERDAS